MTLIWDKFVDIMSNMLENYQALLELSKEKQHILTSTPDVDALTKVTKQEEILALKINKLEKQRQAVIKEIAATCEIKEENLTHELVKSISGIKSLSGEKYAVQIEQLGAELKGCVEQLKNINELNSKLISQYLEFIEFNINVLADATCDQTYSAKQQNSTESQGNRRNLLNAEA